MNQSAETGQDFEPWRPHICFIAYFFIRCLIHGIEAAGSAIYVCMQQRRLFRRGRSNTYILGWRHLTFLIGLIRTKKFLFFYFVLTLFLAGTIGQNPNVLDVCPSTRVTKVFLLYLCCYDRH